ncbi:MAG TPA: STAS domain-containing protein [Planctomycetota bacterium]|nr:STAS domain-containing protein [Planctomycetota bacterium]
MAATFEIINGVLFVTGSLDRSSDDEFTRALEKYAESTAAANRVVDMSNVRWLAPTGAKALISAGQDASEKKGQLRVLASRHVLQTLNLLGAKSWLQIESCLTPNTKPGADAPAAPAKPAAEAPAASPAPQASGVAAPVGLAAAEAPPASSSGTAQAVSASASGSMNAVRGNIPLAGPNEELSRGGHILRVLYPNRRYSFHFPDGELILGLVRERVGGSWVIVETSATRKIINLDMVAYCEIL